MLVGCGFLDCFWFWCSKIGVLVGIVFFVCGWYTMSMVITLEKKEKQKEILITLTTRHLDLIENVREKYDFANQAQALDFMLKAVGATKEKTKTLMVNGVEYTPHGYDTPA